MLEIKCPLPIGTLIQYTNGDLEYVLSIEPNMVLSVKPHIAYKICSYCLHKNNKRSRMLHSNFVIYDVKCVKNIYYPLLENIYE